MENERHKDRQTLPGLFSIVTHKYELFSFTENEYFKGLISLFWYYSSPVLTSVRPDINYTVVIYIDE